MDIEIEIKAMLTKYESMQARSLEMGKLSRLHREEKIQIDTEAQILQKIIWDLKHLLKQVPAGG